MICQIRSKPGHGFLSKPFLFVKISQLIGWNAALKSNSTNREMKSTIWGKEYDIYHFNLRWFPDPDPDPLANRLEIRIGPEKFQKYTKI